LSKSAPIYDEKGELYMVLTTSTDITAQKAAETALRKSEMRFRHLIKSNIIGVLFWDLDGGIVDANDALLTFLGYTRQDIELGLDWRQITPPEWKEQDEEGERQVLATGHHLPFEKQFLHKNGTPVDVIIGSSAFEGTGNRQGLTFILDITGRKQAEKALKESEERFRTMADHIPNLAWMANADGWITWYNSRWYEYTGTTPQQMEGWGWQSVHDPHRLPQVMEEWQSSIATGKPFQMVFPLKGADGVFRPFLTRIIPVYNEKGQIDRWFGTNTEITDQQMVQQQLQTLNHELAATTEELATANEELRSANEEIQAYNEELSETNQRLTQINNDLDNFVYTASHDLKAPITNIEGLMRALERNFSPDMRDKETVRKLTGMIYSSVDRFKRTITDLTQVAKVQKEELEEVTETNLWEMIEEVKFDLEAQITEAAAQVISSVAKDQYIRFSRKNLKSIIYNLLSNAIKYVPTNEGPLSG
jgi:PAS domain S-box-containing protein